MATVKFPQEMDASPTIAGDDKLMIAKATTGEAMQATFDSAKQYLNITGIEVKAVAGGETEDTAVVLSPGPDGQVRKMSGVTGWFKNAGGTPWLAPTTNDNSNWWDGTTWSLGSSVELPTVDTSDLATKSELPVTKNNSILVVDATYPFIPNSAVILFNEVIQFQVNNSYDRTDYIDVSAYGSLTISKGMNYLMAWYDADKKAISIEESATEISYNTYLKPSTAKYAVVNNRKISTGVFEVTTEVVEAVVTNIDLSEDVKLVTNVQVSAILVDSNYPFIDNEAVDSAGGISIKPNVNYRRTDYVQLGDSIKSIVISKGGFTLLAWYTSDKTPISTVVVGSSVTNYQVNKPENASFAIFNDRKTISGDYKVTYSTGVKGVSSDNVYVDNIDLSNVITSLSRKDRFEGKIGSIIGDSISTLPYPYDSAVVEATIWWGIVFKDLGITKGVMSTIGGTSIANAGSNPMVTRVKTMDLSNTDIVFIQGGMNDLGYLNVPLGTFDYSSPLSEQSDTEFIPAYRMIIEDIITRFPSIQVKLMLITHRTLNQPLFPWKNATTGKTWVDFNNAIIQLGKDYQLQVISTSKHINSTINNQITADGVHPFALGHKLIGNDAVNDLKGY